MRRSITMAALGALVAGLASIPGAASASVTEPAVACPSMRQIGSKGYVKDSGGHTVATVRQFKGCGHNWGQIYVWESYRQQLPSWDVCAGVAVTTAGGEVLKYVGNKCDLRGTTKVLLSDGADTLDVCTRAAGAVTDPGTGGMLTGDGFGSTVC